MTVRVSPTKRLYGKRLGRESELTTVIASARTATVHREGELRKSNQNGPLSIVGPRNGARSAFLQPDRYRDRGSSESKGAGTAIRPLRVQ
jgi:hypothetical protein